MLPPITSQQFGFIRFSMKQEYQSGSEENQWKKEKSKLPFQEEDEARLGACSASLYAIHNNLVEIGAQFGSR